MTLLPAAFRRISAPTFLLALAGTALLLFLGWVWLYIPDSHVWAVAFQVLLAAAIAAAFLALYATLIQRLYPTVHYPLWRAALILGGWVLLGCMLQHLVGKLSTDIETRAGYWNSQLNPHHRAFFTYERLLHWQMLTLEALLWIVIPALLLPFAVETIQRRDKPWHAALAALARPQLWLTVAIAYIAGSWLGNHLIGWHPTYTVRGELVSVFFRTLLAYVLAIVLLLLTLATVAELLAREHARRNTIA